MTYGFAAAPLYVEHEVAALNGLGPKVARIYGQGETPMTITAQSPAEIASAHATGDLEALSSVGRTSPGVEIRIADAEDRALPMGKLARCWCAAPRLCKAIGTIRKPVLRRCARWLHTGDIGCQDEFGQLTLKDRSKDTIISGGFNIYPREVEDAALTHPAVAEVSVLGRIHTRSDSLRWCFIGIDHHVNAAE